MLSMNPMVLTRTKEKPVATFGYISLNAEIFQWKYRQVGLMTINPPNLNDMIIAQGGRWRNARIRRHAVPE
jgi:hypothetical protein